MRKACYAVARRSQQHVRRGHRAFSNAVGPSQTQITTLPNKIRVATDSTPGHFSSCGLFVDAGARYETPDILGVSHFLDRMAFKGTTTRSDLEVAAAADKLGGQIMCNSTRESLMYQSSHFHKGTPLALSLIADTVLNPTFLPEELEAQRDATRYEIRELSAKPDMILPEVLHSVAYGNQGLGNSLLCPEHRIDAIDSNTLRRAMKYWYRPERMVIAGAGMPHEQLVELADKLFSSLKGPAAQPPLTYRQYTQTQSPTNILSASAPSVTKTLTRAASYLFPHSVDDSPQLNPHSGYTGGHTFIHNPSAEFDHLYIAYEGAGIHDDDVYAVATMQILLGGGGSFSAGGPGKGMYSRLYTHILNHFSQIEHCASFHHIYTDSSLFGLFASFVPSSKQGGSTPSEILPHIVHQLSLLLYTDIKETELARAKNQLKSSLMMALESQSIQVEDLGRQILVQGRKVPVGEMTAKIDLVTPAHIRKVANSIFGLKDGGKPTVVSKGREDVGDYAATFKTYGLSV
ncbi:mitochondrial processing peptidase [Hymenopellis radicata]|nr:mitochondrial processing peptidase [Hymenopellis radicata]